MPLTSSRFIWNALCAVRANADTNTQNRAHHCAVSALRGVIDSSQSFRVTQSQPKAVKTKTAQLFCETGGSTGVPKVIVRSHASWIASFNINRRLFDITPKDCIAVFGGIGHSLALYGVLEAAHIGADVCMLAGLRPKTQCADLNHHRVSLLYITPTQLRLLTHSGTKCPSVRNIIIGGGALSDGLCHAAKMTFPNAQVTQFYGASETSFITMADMQTPFESVGKPYPDVTLRFTGPDGRDSGSEGEIWVKSPYLFEGYDQGNSKDTDICDGFVTIGEFGRLDSVGNLFLQGRKSRMVTVADQNVFPEEIETFIADTFELEHVVVLARPDNARGHTLIAIVQGHGETEQTILEACRDVFGASKAPRRVLALDSLPLLQSGKPDLITLTNWLETQA